MTPIAGFIIAVIAGLVVRRGRRAALVMAVRVVDRAGLSVVVHRVRASDQPAQYRH